jgi:hypothetical protein
MLVRNPLIRKTRECMAYPMVAGLSIYDCKLTNYWWSLGMVSTHVFSFTRWPSLSS